MKTWLVEWGKASRNKLLGVSKYHWSVARHLGSMLPDGLKDANEKKATRGKMGRCSGMETWALQARLIGMNQQRNQEKMPQGCPQIKGSWLLAAGHSARH